MNQGIRLWHVTVTVAGDRLEPRLVRAALGRLIEKQPFLHSMKYAEDCAEIQYWEEARSLLDASSLALRIWDQHREVAGLPAWEVIGLEVVERDVFHARSSGERLSVADLRDVTPVPF
jgi:hypothetical protein